MIRTRQKHVPWMSIVLLTTTTGIISFTESISGTALTFTMRKFTADPALITFLGSINIAFNFLVAPYTAWKSDRIWTRFGRRRAFMLPGFALLALALIATPLAPSLWMLTAAIIIYQFALDFGYTGPWSPLLYEVVPLHQRGRMVVIKRVMGMVARLLFNWVMIGRFDDIYNLRLGGFAAAITGEQLIYFTGAGLVVAGMLHLLLNVREVQPQQIKRTERFSPIRYLRDIFSERQFLLIYLLLFCNVAMFLSLGQLTPLLITEQFGYSKDLMGKLHAATLVLDMCLVLPLAGLLADRVPRFRMFQIGLFLSTLHPLAYWLFVMYVAPGQIPSPMWIIGFMLANSAVDMLAALSLEPLFFDLVPRDKMGTMNSGFLFVRGVLSVIMMNGVGLWVKYYSLWLAPEGKIDYMSGYLFVFLVGCVGCVASLYFAHQDARGHITYYGRIEEQEAAKPAVSKQPQPVEV